MRRSLQMAKKAPRKNQPVVRRDAAETVPRDRLRVIARVERNGRAMTARERKACMRKRSAIASRARRISNGDLLDDHEASVSLARESAAGLVGRSRSRDRDFDGHADDAGGRAQAVGVSETGRARRAAD